MRGSGVLLFVVAVGSLCAALFLQWAASPLAFGAPAFLPPLALLTAAAWLWILPMTRRLWYAGVSGLILDSIALPPFGTMLLLLLFLSLAAGGLKVVLASRESNVATAVSAAVFCGVVIGGVPIARAVAGYLSFLGS